MLLVKCGAWSVHSGSESGAGKGGYFTALLVIGRHHSLVTKDLPPLLPWPCGTVCLLQARFLGLVSSALEAELQGLLQAGHLGSRP